MKTKRFTEEQAIAVLRESEAGAKTKELCQRHRVLRSDLLQLESEVRWDDGIGGEAAEGIGS